MKDYKNANHPPVPVIKQVTPLSVKSGQWISLDASGTYDPDGDSFSYLWFYYPEAGTYKKEVKISPENYPGRGITAPLVEQPETIHIILKITDMGRPQLSRYRADCGNHSA